LFVGVNYFFAKRNEWMGWMKCRFGLNSHEDIGEAGDGQAEIGRHAVFPNFPKVDAVFVLKAHVGQGAGETVETSCKDDDVEFSQGTVVHPHALLFEGSESRVLEVDEVDIVLVQDVVVVVF
jgi:hypothetical protein